MIQLHNIKKSPPTSRTVAPDDPELPALLERSRARAGRVLGVADAGRRAAPGRMVERGQK